MKIDVIIEIPKNSNIKYEYDINAKQIRIDRILYGANVYPANYGFIANTLDYDGDPLDVLVINNLSFIPGVVAPVRIIGGINMIDNGEIDNKLIGVLDVDPRYDSIKNLQDLEPHYLKEIINFFETYKLLQNKKVIINGSFGLKEASDFYLESIALFKEFQHLISDPIALKKAMIAKYPKKFN